ncbi:protein suppressor of sable isoform X2 [Photinus pyralis]|uniref:protein suppressor of sable isoform X2 n=1 Tax=Photinus pyralis TaxID=7054 RepID=UPI0012673831|nr:protein suppressor of sable isoform X2 [Photinus pyralis]
MALVCDIKSDQPSPQPDLPKDEAPAQNNEDLEDGEIEDDDEEEETPSAPVVVETQTPEPAPQTPPASAKFSPNNNRSRFDRPDRHARYDERKRGHLTEAEKSVLHLHKLERFEREKRDRYKREPPSTNDDFACNIEKAIANVLRKDKKRSDDEKEEEDKRGKKRKKKDKEKKRQKQRRLSPKPDDAEDSEMLPSKDNSPSPHSDPYDSATSSEGKKKSKTKDKKFKKSDPQPKDTQGVCVFYLQGKCTKDNECPFSHELSQPLKLELCKFYLMGCCAKGEKCFYMHSEFPCKFYHTGLPCYAGDSCKFAHGKPLEEGLRQILFKHIETAPKEILGEFPRLSRDGALTMINQAQKALEIKYDEEKGGDPNSIPSLFELNIPVPAELLQKDDEKSDKPASRERNRPSRWQDPDPVEDAQVNLFGIKGFYSERGDQDMRVNSGDVDMRTLPPQLNTQPVMQSLQDVDIRPTQDTDIRQLNAETPMDFTKDVDIRQMSQQFEMASKTNDDNGNATDEPNLQIVEEGAGEKTDAAVELPETLPKKQRELFLRIRAQQKENVPTIAKETDDEEPSNIDWYSDDDDDDDDNRLTIGDDIEEPKPKVEEPSEPPVVLPSQIKPVEVIEKLGDLSKIDISAEVTKMLLSSINQTAALIKDTITSPKDPRSGDPPKTDPRRTRQSSTEAKKAEKQSIYDQGSISLDNSKDVDLRNLEDTDLRPQFRDTDLRASSRPDIDLRQLGLPFKAMQNYTPASEIDASINTRTPIEWRVHLVDIPKPDYTGLKLTPHEAQNTGDPRLRKIFRLNSTEEKDSPASPKESPKPVATVRNDPRRRKLDEKPPAIAEVNMMNYSQQLNILQTSAFYQSLTSNQKVLLNQELASKYDHSGSNDPTLNGILSNLGLLSNASAVLPNANTSALNILANINNMTPMMQPSNIIVPQNQQPFVNQMPQNPNVVQPGLLGAAPGLPNMPPDFQLNFDPRQGGLLGNAPNYNYNNDNSNFNNFNDNYYEDGGGNYVENNPVTRGGRGGRGGFRDRPRRGGRNFGRNNSRNFRSRNRNNRSRTPP